MWAKLVMPLVQERQHSGDQLRLRARTLEIRGCCVFLGGNTPLDRPLEISTRLFNFSVHRFLRRVLISEKQRCLVRMGDISPIILSVKYQPEFCPGKRLTNLEFTEVGLDGSVITVRRECGQVRIAGLLTIVELHTLT